MLAKELRLLGDDELNVRLDDTYRELFSLRQDWYLGRLEDNNRVIAAKRDIARIKTILREREMARLIQGGAQ